MTLANLIEEAKRFLEYEKEYAYDVEAYTGCYETSKDSWFGFRSAYKLISNIVKAYEKEDC